MNNTSSAEHGTGAAPRPFSDRQDSGARRARRGEGPIALYTIDEAAALLRVKKSWLERQAAKRKIPFSMLGGAYHFTSQHLATIVHMNEQVPAAGRQVVIRRSARKPARQEPGLLDVKPLRPRPRPGPRSAA